MVGDCPLQNFQCPTIVGTTAMDKASNAIKRAGFFDWEKIMMGFTREYAQIRGNPGEHVGKTVSVHLNGRSIFLCIVFDLFSPIFLTDISGIDY
jgi:hypothetical protein